MSNITNKRIKKINNCHVKIIDDETSIMIISGKEFFVDTKNISFLKKYNWSNSKGYAICSFYYNGKKMCISMHRLLMGLPTLDVDHINRNSHDNRLCNLRLATVSENMHNSIKRKKQSGFKGVTLSNYDKRKKNWTTAYSARITINKKRIHIGTFKTAQEAAMAYDEIAYKHYGDFAVLNFPRKNNEKSSITPIKKKTKAEAALEFVSEVNSGKFNGWKIESVQSEAKRILEMKD